MKKKRDVFLLRWGEMRLVLRKMKLTAILCLLVLFSFGNSFSQVKLSVQFNNADVRDILTRIEEKTNYIFLYKDDIFDFSKKVTMDFNEAAFEQVLKSFCQQTDTKYELRNRQIILTTKSSGNASNTQQTRTREIKGLISDPNGAPLPGVSIAVAGSNIGTVSDAKGEFSIKIPASVKKLSFSFIGMQSQELPVPDNNFIHATMQEATVGVDEVIVVGYGTQKKINVTGSIAQVDAKELQTAPSGNLSSMLQGRLPGLITKQTTGQPGSDGATLIIRGLSTLGNNSPLVIVDGIEREFPNVNQEEIESVTILKDATSAAVYGVRAANGVILVTTKRGRMQKPTITMNSAVSLSSNTSFPKFLNGPDYAYWFNKAEEMDGVPEGSRRFTADEIDRITNGDPQGIYGNTDWFDLLFEDVAPSYTNNISMNGGNEKVNYFVSIGSYNQEGIIKRTAYDRYNVRANLDAKISNSLSLSFNFAAQQSETKEPGLSAGIGNSYCSIFSQAMLAYPIIPAFTADGMYTGTQNTGNGNQSPLAARDLSGRQISKSNKFQSNMTMLYNVPFIKGLDLKFTAAYDKGYTLKKTEFLPFKISVFNQSTRKYEETYGRHALSGEAQVLQWFADTYNATLQSSVSYNNSFGKHDVGGLFLYEYSESGGQSMSNGRKNFPITEIMDLNYGEQVIDDMIKGGHSSFARAGYVGRLNYAYNKKYLFEFTARVDGSPLLPAENRWGFFPGMAMGWRISDEPFFKQVAPFVDNLKLRASVGKLGNDAIGDFAYIRTMSMGADPVVMIGNILSRHLGVNGVPNENIKWETTTSYNLGLESTLWKGLLGIELDGFYMVTKDILQSQGGLMPPSLGGYFPATINSGVVDNRGFELVLTHRNKIGDLSYNIRGNVSWARNKIIQTTENPNIPDNIRQTGKSIGLKYGLVAEGLFQTEEEIAMSALYGPTLPGDVKMKDLNGDGRITYDQDRDVVGKSNTPEMMFGLNMGAEYKGFDFNLFMQGAALCDVSMCGYYSDRGFSDNTFYTRPFFADGNSPYYLIENAWRPDNTDAKYPRLGVAHRSNGAPLSSFWLRNGAYLRLKNAQIGYTLPRLFTNRFNIEKVRVYVSGSNLFTLDYLEYLDPEMPDVNQGYYPQQRVFEFGINLTF